MTSLMYSLLLCASLLVVSQALPHGPHFLQRRASNRFCGEILRDVLALICNNVYYSPQLKKGDDLSYSATNEPWWRRLQQTETRSLDDGFVDGQVAMTLLDKRDIYGRLTRGANDECCKKSCTYTELSSYCGNDDSMV